MLKCSHQICYLDFRLVYVVELIDELNQIELELKEKDNKPEVAKRFWKVVGKIKRMNIDEVDDSLIMKAAEIRSKLFKKKVILSSNKGIVLFSFGFITALLVFIWFILYFPSTSAFIFYFTFFVLELFVLYFTFLVGRIIGGLLSGVKFEGFYKFSPLEFGMKLDYASYLKSTQKNRALFFGFTILWEHIILMFQLVFAWLFRPEGIWVPLVFLIILLPSQYVIHRFAKEGELHRFIRELKILRETINR